MRAHKVHAAGAPCRQRLKRLVDEAGVEWEVVAKTNKAAAMQS